MLSSNHRKRFQTKQIQLNQWFQKNNENVINLVNIEITTGFGNGIKKVHIVF